MKIDEIVIKGNRGVDQKSGIDGSWKLLEKI